MNTPNIVWLLIFYAIGYVSGLLSQKDKVMKYTEEAKKSVLHMFDDDSDDSVGVVNRPTAKQLAERSDPQSKMIKDTKEVMKETLDKLIKI